MSGLLLQRSALLLYLLSTAAFMVFTVRQNKRAGRSGNWLIGAGFALHTLSLFIRTIGHGQLPILNFAEALGFFGWTVAGGYLILFYRFRLHVLGAFASPLALLTTVLCTIITSEPLNITPIFQSVWLTLHLGFVFSGYGFFGLASIAGGMYLMQERQIKSKKPGRIYKRLPSLNVLDNMNNFSITLGFPLMTIGMITGMVLAQTTLGTYWRWDPKEVWSLILWLLYAALLHQRLAVGWRGRKAAIMSIVGFSLLCFTFAGVSYLMPGYHSFESLKQYQVQ